MIDFPQGGYSLPLCINSKVNLRLILSTEINFKSIVNGHNNRIIKLKDYLCSRLAAEWRLL